jgi:hypothetical protein
MTGRTNAEQRRADRIEEAVEAAGPLVGVFVAKAALYVDGARAFAPGDIVPAEHVERFAWRDLVRDFDDNESGD